MFKDYNKYLSTSLKVYLFVLLIIFILKIVGLDYFGIDLNNPIITKINFILDNPVISFIWNYCVLFLYSFILYSVICDKKKPFLEAFILTTVDAVAQIIVSKYGLYQLIIPIELVTWTIVILIFKNKIRFLYFIKIFLIMFLYQIIVNLVRNDSLKLYETNLLIQQVLSFDQLLIFVIYYNLYWKGVRLECGKIVGLFSQARQT